MSKIYIVMAQMEPGNQLFFSRSSVLHQSGRNLSNAKGEGLFLHFTVGSVLPVGNLFNAQVRIKKKKMLLL